jgi:hypothetical protein
VLIHYDPEAGEVTAIVNGKVAARATVLADRWAERFECKFSSAGGGTAEVVLSDLALRSRSPAAAAPPPSAGNSPTRDADGWQPLTASRELLRKHWSQGDNRGSFNFSRGDIEIISPWDLGTLKYEGKWKELRFRVTAKALSFGNFDLTINGTTLALGKAVDGAGGVPVLVRYDPAAGEVTAAVNGKVAARSTVLADKWADRLQCKFTSNGGGTATVTLADVAVR